MRVAVTENIATRWRRIRLRFVCVLKALFFLVRFYVYGMDFGHKQ